MEHHNSDRAAQRAAPLCVGPAELAAGYEHASTGRVVVDAEGRVVRVSAATE